MQSKRLFLNAFFTILFSFFIIGFGFAQIDIDDSPYKIAMSHDGNAHDADDIVALPMALAILAEAGLKDRLVHVDYSNNIWHDNGNTNDTIENQVVAMQNAVSGSASQWEYFDSVFYEVRLPTELTAAKNNFAAKVADAYNAGEQLYYLLGGPMEVPYQCIMQVPEYQRSSITVVSHSVWNESYQHGNSKVWQDIMNTGVKSVQIADQNDFDCDSCGEDDDMSTRQFAKWQWLDNMGSKYQWLYHQNPFQGKFDVSDAGMVWWVVTGRPGIGSESNPENLRDNTDSNLYGSPAKIEELFHIGPVPGTPPGNGEPIPGKIEAENFETQSGINSQVTSDEGGGENIGWINNNDWAEYKVNVLSSDQYEVKFRVASAGKGGTIEISSGNTVLGSVTVPITGGWQEWTTISTNIELAGGIQTLRLSFVGGKGDFFNINWVEFAVASQPPPAPSYFFIVNKGSGKKFRPENNMDNAKILQAPDEWVGHFVQWEQIHTDNGYFYLKNRATGKYFSPATHQDFSDILQKPAIDGDFWAQWKTVDTGDGYFHLENRATGKRIRSRSTDDMTAGNDYKIEQSPISWTALWVRWKFVEINAGARVVTNQNESRKHLLVEKKEGEIPEELSAVKLFPNPVSAHLNIHGIAEETLVQIFDMKAQEIISTTGQDLINVAKLPLGTYVLLIDGKHKYRFVKN